MSHVVSDPAQIKIDKLFIKKNNNQTITVRDLTGATKVKELRRKLEDLEGDPFKEVIYAFGGKQISNEDNEKILADFGIKNGSVLNVIFRVLGGMQHEGSPQNEAHENEPEPNDGPRKILANTKNVPKDIKLVNEECCFLGGKPPDKCMNSKMKCGHVVSPDGVFEYLKSTIETDNKFVIKCPMSGCNVVWDIQDCLFGSVATADEEKHFMEKLNVNMLKDPASNCKECPKCGAYVMRPKELLKNRVRCPVCDGKDWCWWCLQEWIGLFDQLCLREDCSHGAHVADLLINCDKVEVNGIKNVPCRRLCPQCGALLEWTNNCKHLTCTACAYEFCLSCLKQWKEVGGNKHLKHTTPDKCPIHKVQLETK